MQQHKLVLDVTDRRDAHRYAAALTDLIEPPPQALTLFEDGSGWRVEAYYLETPDANVLSQALAVATELPAPAVRIEAVPDENWVALSQAALPPVEAGRFVVHGSHDRARVARGPNTIEIEAGEAFGTAHHATTFGCLETVSAARELERHSGRRWRRVLDLGTGSGVLAIALARIMPRTALIATDLDVRSVEVAISNAVANGTGRRIRFYVADGLNHTDIRTGRPFDAIVANILAGPLISLSAAVSKRLARRGILILSGILIPQAPAVIAAYRAHGVQVVTHRRINGWSTLVLQKR